MLERLRLITSRTIQVGTKFLRLLFPRTHLRALIRLNRQAFVRWRLRARIAAHVRDHGKFVTERYASVVRIRQKPLTPAEQVTKASQYLNLERIIGQETGRHTSLVELNSLVLPCSRPCPRWCGAKEKPPGQARRFANKALCGCEKPGA